MRGGGGELLVLGWGLGGVLVVVEEGFVLGVGLMIVAVECGCFAAMASIPAVTLVVLTSVGRIPVSLRIVVVVGHID